MFAAVAVVVIAAVVAVVVVFVVVVVVVVVVVPQSALYQVSTTMLSGNISNKLLLQNTKKLVGWLTSDHKT